MFFLTGEGASGAPGSGASPCGITKAQLVSRMQLAVDATNEAATNKGIVGLKIVMTGYCVPHVPECGGSTQMTTLLDAFQQIANDNANVEFHDISTQVTCIAI